MTQLVRMTRDILPWRKGQNVAMPDAMAAKAIEQGLATDPRPMGIPMPAAEPAMPPPARNRMPRKGARRARR